MKKLEIEKTKPTFFISVLKVEYWVVLVSSISNFFSNITSHANKWMRKKIPTCSNSALVKYLVRDTFLLLKYLPCLYEHVTWQINGILPKNCSELVFK